MSEGSTWTTSALRSVPPISPGAMPARQSSWPTVLGVIAVVIGSLGVIGQGCLGALGLILQPVMFNAMRTAAKNNSAMFDAQAQVTARFLPFQIANVVMMTCL